MTNKGQITIPIEIRRRLGLKAGQVFEFDEHAPYLKAVKAFDVAAMERVLGRFHEALKDASTDERLEATRGPVALPQAKSEA